MTNAASKTLSKCVIRDTFTCALQVLPVRLIKRHCKRLKISLSESFSNLVRQYDPFWKYYDWIRFVCGIIATARIVDVSSWVVLLKESRWKISLYMERWCSLLLFYPVENRNLIFRNQVTLKLSPIMVSHKLLLLLLLCSKLKFLNCFARCCN